MGKVWFGIIVSQVAKAAWVRVKETAGYVVGLPIGLALGAWDRWRND